MGRYWRLKDRPLGIIIINVRDFKGEVKVCIYATNHKELLECLQCDVLGNAVFCFSEGRYDSDFEFYLEIEDKRTRFAFDLKLPRVEKAVLHHYAHELWIRPYL